MASRPHMASRKADASPRHLTFVTGNAGKVAELRSLAEPLGFAVAQDKRGYPEVQAESLGEVCAAGADHLLASGLKPPFLLEDSGLFVAALNGFPGVYARHTLDTIGCQGLLKLLVDVEEELRSAAFRTHLLYVDAAGERHAFEGTCKGRIASRPAGAAGFGFDPVFVPAGAGVGGRTFAQMDTAEKTRLSHRGQAVRAFLAHLAKSAKT
jgi:XTP/dITP diphosphohydrolase